MAAATAGVAAAVRTCFTSVHQRAGASAAACTLAAAGASPLRRDALRGSRLLGRYVAARGCAVAPLARQRGDADASAAAAAAAAASTPSASSTATSALEVAAEAQPPSLAQQPSSVADIEYKGPIGEDMTGGARHASTVNAMWSNIPSHVRASFEAHANVDEAPVPAKPLMMDGLLNKAKALAARTGLAPVGWARAQGDVSHYYNGQIPLAPYKKGQTAAYNYPRILVPREVALRFPIDMYVDPVFQTSDPAQRLKMKSATLFPRLQGKTTLLLIFSGQPLSSLWTGVRQWLDSIGDQFGQLPDTQVFKLHCEEGWFNRRTHQLTKFQLRRQVAESELFTTFVYSGKWKWEYVEALHLYDKNLPVVLLLDKLGYVRWHSVGLPSQDATAVFRDLVPRLAREKRRHL